MADAHVSVARVLHDGGNVGKVEVDEAGVGNEVGDGVDSLEKNVVSDLESVLEGELLIGRVLEAIVRDDKKGVNLRKKVCDTLVSLIHAALALKAEGLGDYADGEYALLARDLGNYGTGAGSGAAAHTSGDEYHVGILENLGDIVAALLGGLFTYLGVGACALTVGQLFADLYLFIGSGKAERGLIGVEGNEGRSLGAGLDHAVDYVIAGAAYADDLYIYYIFGSGFNGSVCRHIFSSCILLQGSSQFDNLPYFPKYLFLFYTQNLFRSSKNTVFRYFL